MKRFLFILNLAFVISTPLFAQDSTDVDNDGGGEKIQKKMTEYIQKRLNLSKAESAKFSPVFIKYFKEWRQTIHEYRGDRLVLQQKIVELRLRFRPQFREILGERRGDQVFNQQDRFIQEIKDLWRERRQNNRGTGNGSLRRNG